MKMDENNKAVLTKNEDNALATYKLLREGKVSVTESAREALETMPVRPTRQFVEWLSMDNLTFTHGEVVDVEVAEPAAVA